MSTPSDRKGDNRKFTSRPVGDDLTGAFGQGKTEERTYPDGSKERIRSHPDKPDEREVENLETGEKTTERRDNSGKWK